MSSFTKPADVRLLDSYKFKLLREFEFYKTGSEGVWWMLQVPPGFVTDLASVPRILWSIFPPHGKYAKAAILHDYMYEKAIENKSVADETFREAMEVLGVPKWRRTVMYWAVRIFGRGNY